MLDRIRMLITNNPKRENFFRLVGRRFPQGSDGYQLIERAYDTAKDAFRGEVREGNGERYFEHLRAVALIDMEYLRVTDAEIISAALLHDIVEDIPGWTQDRVALKFSSRIAQLVWWVTKQPVENFAGDREERTRVYHQNLNRAPREAIIIKLADRLHNLLTLWELDADKQLRKVRETQDFYVPLAERHIILIHEIEQAHDEVKAGLKKLISQQKQPSKPRVRPDRRKVGHTEKLAGR